MSNKYPATIQVPKSPTDTDINKAVLDLLSKINSTNEYTDTQIKAVQDSISLVAHPIGEVQIQFPGQGTPKAIYGGTWINITSVYAGLFFRAEGGNALSFESGTQGFAMQGHLHGAVSVAGAFIGNTVANWTVPGGSSPIGTANFGMTSIPLSDGTHGTPQTDGETRPVNQSIRIWKRSA